MGSAASSDQEGDAVHQRGDAARLGNLYGHRCGKNRSGKPTFPC